MDKELFLPLAFLGVVLLIIVIILVFAMARIIMEPLKNISVTIQKISAGSYTRELKQRVMMNLLT